MTNHPNRSKFVAAARDFVADHIRRNDQWSTRTIERYLPEGMRLRDGAEYSGPVTISSIAAFMRAEAVRS